MDYHVWGAIAFRPNLATYGMTFRAVLCGAGSDVNEPLGRGWYLVIDCTVIVVGLHVGRTGHFSRLKCTRDGGGGGGQSVVVVIGRSVHVTARMRGRSMAVRTATPRRRRPEWTCCTVRAWLPSVTTLARSRSVGRLLVCCLGVEIFMFSIVSVLINGLIAPRRRRRVGYRASVGQWQHSTNWSIIICRVKTPV